MFGTYTYTYIHTYMRSPSCVVVCLTSVMFADGSYKHHWKQLREAASDLYIRESFPRQDFHVIFRTFDIFGPDGIALRCALEAGGP